MNVVNKLFDEQYVLSFFRKRVLGYYPDFADIKKVKIVPVKKQVWKTSYHVVIKFETYFVTDKGKTNKIPIYCSAHSYEPRKNVYSVLKFLWQHNFCRGYLTAPRPLFYSHHFRAVFYRGIKGENLYYYIRKGTYEEMEQITKKAAAWLVKLHKLPTYGAINFNKQNSRIDTAIPGRKHILDIIEYFYPELHEFYCYAYKYMVEQEKKFFRSTDKRWVIHGDAHPENVIMISNNKVAFIDFNDLCLGDFARDVGSFIQQVDYMTGVKAGKKEHPEALKEVFLNSYLKYAKLELDDDLNRRINLYYQWTALRTATYFLLRHDPSRERAEPLIKGVEEYLDSKDV